MDKAASAADGVASAGVQGPVAVRSARAGIAGLALRPPARAKVQAARRPASKAQAAQPESASHESHGTADASGAAEQRLAQVAAALGTGGMETYLASQQAMQEQQMAMSLIEAQQALAKRASDMVKSAVS